MNGLLHDTNGQTSTTRVAALGCTATACAAVVSWSFLGGPQPDMLMLATLLGGGLGAKVIQRGVETKSGGSST